MTFRVMLIELGEAMAVRGSAKKFATRGRKRRAIKTEVLALTYYSKPRDPYPSAITACGAVDAGMRA
jgi:hypothetical protein